MFGNNSCSAVSSVFDEADGNTIDDRQMAVIKCEFEMAGEEHARAGSDGLVSEPVARQLGPVRLNSLKQT
jgi:hypothetical protein